jgi:hypothetical protein
VISIRRSAVGRVEVEAVSSRPPTSGIRRRRARSIVSNRWRDSAGHSDRSALAIPARLDSRDRSAAVACGFCHDRRLLHPFHWIPTGGAPANDHAICFETTERIGIRKTTHPPVLFHTPEQQEPVDRLLFVRRGSRKTKVSFGCPLDERRAREVAGWIQRTCTREHSMEPGGRPNEKTKRVEWSATPGRRTAVSSRISFIQRKANE